VSGAPMEVQPDLDMNDPSGVVNVAELCKKLPRLELVKQIAERRRFFHWELEYVDLFARRGGFDLIAGNPPWVKIVWNEGGILSEKEPRISIRDLSAPEIASTRSQQLLLPGRAAEYLAEYEESAGAQNFLTAIQNYPHLRGQQTNLYKCFITRSWELCNDQSAVGFLHPEGVYDDPKAGPLRRVFYPRLKLHFQFQNEKKLFPIGNRNKFSINIFAPQNSTLDFCHIANLFVAGTVDACFEHEGNGPVPGIKSGGDEDDDANAEWTVSGHRDRIIRVNEEGLNLFASIYDDAGTPAYEARLPTLHSIQLVEVLRKFAAYPRRVGDEWSHFFGLDGWWNETGAQNDGTIKRHTCFAGDAGKTILSGPHFGVAKPFFQTPKEVCQTHRAYDQLDLQSLPDDYLPRTNYVPSCALSEYQAKVPRLPWKKHMAVTDVYRIVNRRQLSQGGERTLVAAIIPPGLAHINTVTCIASESSEKLLSLFAYTASVIADFYIKSTGRGDHYSSGYTAFPLLPNDHRINSRVLVLNSITKHYAELWNACWIKAYRSDEWFGEDSRLNSNFWAQLTPEWNAGSALRSDFARRWALVELDVLVSRHLALSLAELQTIYRIQFPVMRQYEADTWYDQQGRIVFTSSKGLPGVGFTRAEWNEIRDMKSGSVSRTVTDNTLPAGPVERTIEYVAPFTRCDREQDYATVWAKLDERESK
jgi:hypothetical protein